MKREGEGEGGSEGSWFSPTYCLRSLWCQRGNGTAAAASGVVSSRPPFLSPVTAFDSKLDECDPTFSNKPTSDPACLGQYSLGFMCRLFAQSGLAWFVFVCR